MKPHKVYVYQQDKWPEFFWDNNHFASLLGKVRYKQGKIVGLVNTLGFTNKNTAQLDTLTQDVLKSSEIEGEMLNTAQVRSSLARRLGLEIAGLVQSDRKVDGVVEMMLDATQNYNKPLTKKRLFDWHAALFPTGRNGMYNINVGKWRDDKNGAMQVVSGAMGKEKVHFQAPDAKFLNAEMKRFLTWFNKNDDGDPVIKAAVGHFWFVTVHPFDDGNGRIARALADMLLARSDAGNQRFYSMSASIRKDRNSYYEMLEKTQKGNLDLTKWLQWFLGCLDSALSDSEKTFESVLHKAAFYDKHHNKNFNERQRLMINKLFDGFEGKLSTSKWAKINKCSQDTALRDVQELLKLKVLSQESGGGRNTSYVLKKVKV